MVGIFLALIDTEEQKSKFILLYEQYRKLMFYVANEVLHDTHLAEDAVQEAFFRIAKNFSKIGEVSCPQTKSFVVIITRNVALTMISKESKERSTVEEASLVSDVVTDTTFDDVAYNELIDAILELPEKYRDVLYLHHVYGYSYNEVANLLGVSSDATKKRAQRAKAKLIKELES